MVVDKGVFFKDFLGIFPDALQCCIGKGIFSAVTLTVGTQPSGRGMADEPCDFIDWEKNTIYLP